MDSLLVNSILFMLWEGRGHYPVSKSLVHTLAYICMCEYLKDGDKKPILFRVEDNGPTLDSLDSHYPGTTITDYWRNINNNAFMHSGKKMDVVLGVVQACGDMNDMDVAGIVKQPGSGWHKAHQRGDETILVEDMLGDYSYDHCLPE